MITPQTDSEKMIATLKFLADEAYIMDERRTASVMYTIIQELVKHGSIHHWYKEFEEAIIEKLNHH